MGGREENKDEKTYCRRPHGACGMSSYCQYLLERLLKLSLQQNHKAEFARLVEAARPVKTATDATRNSQLSESGEIVVFDSDGEQT